MKESAVAKIRAAISNFGKTYVYLKTCGDGDTQVNDTIRNFAHFLYADWQKVYEEFPNEKIIRGRVFWEDVTFDFTSDSIERVIVSCDLATNGRQAFPVELNIQVVGLSKAFTVYVRKRDEEKPAALPKVTGSVLQPWVMELPLMQQTVLLTATRAPDGLRKTHPVKTLCRWLRRCYLISAFDQCVLDKPHDPRGGSFMGPCCSAEVRDLFHAADLYIETGDEIPLHFHFHLIQAVEILGFKHPDSEIKKWWLKFYFRLAAFAHLCPEAEYMMDKRLSDNKENWEAREA